MDAPAARARRKKALIVAADAQELQFDREGVPVTAPAEIADCARDHVARVLSGLSAAGLLQRA